MSSDRVVVKKVLEPYLIPKFEIFIDERLAYMFRMYTVRVFGAHDHPMYVDHLRSMRSVTTILQEYKLCGGVNATELTTKLYHHVVPIEMNDENDNC